MVWIMAQIMADYEDYGLKNYNNPHLPLNLQEEYYNQS